MNRMRYVFVPRRTNVHHLYTFWIAADLNDSEGRQLLREAFEYIESNADVRIGVIINPSSDTDNVDSSMDINKIASAANKRSSRGKGDAFCS